MVVSQNYLSSDIGAEILSKGGNAVDAAIAVGFSLTATLPRAGNIGGGGFMLVYDKKTEIYEYGCEVDWSVDFNDSEIFFCRNFT